MKLPIRTIPIEAAAGVEPLLDREWLVTNGLGGYASGTIANVPTRRYHGLLIAALPAPLGRVMMLNYVSEQVRLPGGRTLRLGGFERTGGRLEVAGLECIREFRLEGGLPTWTFELDGFVFEKQLLMPHEQNGVHVTYRLLEGQQPLRLTLRPALQFRGHDDFVNQAPAKACSLQSIEEHQKQWAGEPEAGEPTSR